MESHDSQLMTAARPIAALAARVASDEDLVAQLTHAAHQGDQAAIQRIVRSAGGRDATVTVEHAAAAGKSTVIGVHFDLGPIHINISVEIKK